MGPPWTRRGICYVSSSLGLRKEAPDVMYTDVTFSMDGRSSAAHRVGSSLVPQASHYFARWVDRDNRSYVTITVRTSLVEDMVVKLCRMHPTVRCISREKVLPTTTAMESEAS